MTPRQYEELVASFFRGQGYTVELTPFCNDYGVDVFARRGDQKLAVQAKMYGGTGRKVNRDMVMQLHGAKDYFDCTAAVIVTDGEVAASAAEIAAKLRIAIQHLSADDRATDSIVEPKPKPGAERLPASIHAGNGAFDKIWEQYILPMTGRTITEDGVRANRVLQADWSGIKRITSNGKKQFIPIEIFRQAINHIFEQGCVSRAEINERYAKRASSGVVLILSQVPLFDHLSGPSRLVLRQNTT